MPLFEALFSKRQPSSGVERAAADLPRPMIFGTPSSVIPVVQVLVVLAQVREVAALVRPLSGWAVSISCSWPGIEPVDSMLTERDLPVLQATSSCSSALPKRSRLTSFAALSAVPRNG